MVTCVVSFYIVPCVFLSSFLLVEVENVARSFNVPTQSFYTRTLIYFTCLPISIRYFGCILNPRNVKCFLFSGVGIFIMSNTLSAITKIWSLFLFFQAINSIADGLVIICVSLIFKFSMAQNKLGQVYGMNGAVIALTSAIALSIGNTVAYYIGWRAVFFIISAFSLLILLLSHRVIPSASQSTYIARKKFMLSNSLKFLIFAKIIFCINFIISQNNIYSFLSILYLVICFISLIIIIFFDKI